MLPGVESESIGSNKKFFKSLIEKFRS
jgi:hypothetical protein